MPLDSYPSLPQLQTITVRHGNEGRACDHHGTDIGFRVEPITLMVLDLPQK